MVDEVLFSDQSPWPCGSDGTGNSLQRVQLRSSGNDPANWSAEPPTAGRERENLPPGLPAITAQPQDRIVATNASASFSVSVCGTSPFTYQWRFNSAVIPNATNATFTLVSAAPSNAGQYSVTVSNPAGSVASLPATLVVQFPPLIVSQPQPVTAIRDQSATFNVTAGGTPPFSYQWRFNGVSLAGQTNFSLVIFPVRTNDAGAYSVLVQNAAGTSASASALLSVLIPATVTQQPFSRTNKLTLASTNPVAYNPTNATFTANAVGIGALTYQWKRNGVALSGANSPSYTVVNVTPADAGSYTVSVTDSVGPTESLPAALVVLVDPVFIITPANQSAPAGANVTFSVSIIGYPPPFGYEWRKGSVAIVSNTSSDTVNFFTTNVIAGIAANSSTGRYSVVVRNLSKPTGTLSASATLLQATDTDGDGIPDEWESTYFGSTTSADPNADSDGDTMSNAQEYLAGTDPKDGLSFLKVENIEAAGVAETQVQIEFNAVSNRTYSVLFRQDLANGSWSKVSDVVATSTNRLVRVLDTRPVQSSPRFYRLVTPKNP